MLACLHVVLAIDLVFCIGCTESDCAVINIIGIFIKREKSENLRVLKEKQEQLLRESLLSDQKVLAVPFHDIKILIRLFLTFTCLV